MRVSTPRKLLTAVLVVAFLAQLLQPAATQAAVTAAPAAATPAPAPERNLTQLALNAAVSRAVGAAALTTVAVDSQLDEATLMSTPSHVAGSGSWRLDLLDEQKQPFRVEGTLNFEVSRRATDQGIPDTSVTIRGTLKGAEVELALDATQSGALAAGALVNRTSQDVQLTRNGKATRTAMKTTGETARLAYGLVRSTYTSSLDRDGVRAENALTTTARIGAHGEGEFWVQMLLHVPGEQAPDLSSDAHFFAHRSQVQSALFFDRVNLKVGDQRVSLQSPGSVTLGSDGRTTSDLALVDENGERIDEAGAPLLPGATATPVARIARSVVVGFRSPGPDPIASSWASSGQGPDFLGLCREDYAALAIGLLFAIGFGLFGAFLVATMFEGGFLLATLAEFMTVDSLMGLWIGLLYGGLLQWLQRHHPEHAALWSLLSILISGLFGGLLGKGLGGGLIGGITGYFGGAFGAAAGLAIPGTCNGDPYFVSPPVRSLADAPSTGPVRILDVTGGLVAPEAIAAGGPAGAARPASRTASEYDERPDAFVGGSVPSGATGIGEWQWDATRPFGAAPSHTQAATTGAQKHYFIHASKPLQVGPDDNIIQYVYLDPKNPPAEVYLQLYAGGDGEHRAYWGADRAQTGGAADTPSLSPMGALPQSGGWVRLKVPADRLGLSGKSIDGVLYGAYDGQTWWGPTTISSRLTDRAPDSLSIVTPDAPIAGEPGAQIAYEVQVPAKLSVEIVEPGGSVVRTLRREADVRPGYRVEVWDGKDDAGATAPDRAYRARFTIGARTVAETDVSLTPFVAHIQTPPAFSLIRGNDVPVIGEAYGPAFSRYVLEYGEGLRPTAWMTVTTSEAPVVLPTVRRSGINRIGNLANWDVGVDEFTPWGNPGLNGVYTLRLRVIGKDGRQATDSVPVIVGRLAHSAEGGTITSPDGNARLIVPPLATQTSFELLALVPAAQLEAGAPSLPVGKKLAGPVYEVFPAAEIFRRPAMLELPYDAAAHPEQLGVMLSDGQTWRYIGGTADPARQIVRVPVTEFGGERAWVAPFAANVFGPVLEMRATSAPLAFTPNAPVISSPTHPAAFYDDFTSSADEIAPLDEFGTRLSRVEGADAGLPAGAAALRVERAGDGVRLVQLRATPYDAAKYPTLSFDYRLPPGYVPNLLIKSRGMWWQLKTGPTGKALSHYYWTVNAPEMIADGAWHHYQVDVLARLPANDTPGASVPVESIVLGQAESGAYMQVNLVDDGSADAYYLANIAALAPASGPQPAVVLSAPATTRYSGYSLALDAKSDTVPPEQDQGAAPQVTLPPNAPDGLWYVHVRGQSPDGRWSATAHYPLLLDRQPPVFGAPLPSGAGLPFILSVPVDDESSGIDLSSLRFTLNGRSYSAGKGVAYRPEEGTLRILPFSLEPPLEPPSAGQKVTVAITALADSAGNRIAAPLSWSFAVDRPQATGDDFRALTLDGESPSLAPDGSQAAFVSQRSGVKKVWIIRADDYEEKNQSAHPLLAGTAPARESDPAWSPDGTSLAYVSDEGGAPQVRLAGADGGGARALTAGKGTMVASPTWSPDGKTLAFIRDGNLWQIDSDGSGERPLTSAPDRSYRSVRWQPGGGLLALGFDLYEQRIELYDTATGEIRPLTHGGRETQPAWLNAHTVLYTAPAGQDLPDAIWQVGLDGTGQALLPGSGRTGVGDMQADTAADGNATALVSTRGGTRAVWLRSVLQISRFSAEPAGGAPAGEPIRIAYALPAESDVTLQVLHADGTPARVLLQGVRQPVGPQSASWNGTDAGEKPIAPGTYAVRLMARPVAGGDPLERFIDATVLDAQAVGSLQVQVQQWAGQAIPKFNGAVRIYAAGSRVQPAAQADGDNAPTFKLPAGKYDVVAVLDDLRREVKAVRVEAGTTTAQAIDLGLGELKLSVTSAPGQPAGNNVLVTVTPADAVGNAPVRLVWGSAGDFLLPPGRYDVVAELEGVRRVSYGVEVPAGQVTTHEMNLGSGLVRVSVLAFAGRPADPRTVVVEAYRAEDRTTTIGHSLYQNPAELRVPAGRYDLRVIVDAGPPRGPVNGHLEEWINGVEIAPGETVARNLDLKVGQVQIEVFEAADKPAEDNRTELYIVPRGESNWSKNVASVSFARSAQVFLRAGAYQVVPGYASTILYQLGPQGEPFEVRPGEVVTYTLNLKLGRIQLQVLDAAGQPLPPERVQVSAFPPGKRATREYFSYAPKDLLLQAGVSYDLEVYVDNTKKVELAAQTVNEGETRVLTLQEADFKP